MVRRKTDRKRFPARDASGHQHDRDCTCRKRFRAGVPGAVAPGKIILESPPSPEGQSALRARVGGMGATKQAKGRGSRRQRRQATPADTTAARSASDQPLTRPTSTTNARRTSAARIQARGCKGRSPLHEITLVSPFPPGRGSGGWGDKASQRQGRQAAKKASPPPGTAAAWSAGTAGASPPPGAGLRHPVPVPPGFSRRAPVRRGL